MKNYIFSIFKNHQVAAYCLTSITGTLIFLLALELKNPGFFLYDNNADFFLPFYIYNWRAVIENHSLPFINFHQFLGYRYLGQGQTGVLYIPVYLSYFISQLLFKHPYYLIDVLVIGHFLLASSAMYLLLRSLRLKQQLSLLGGWIWVSFPFLYIVSKGWVVFAYVTAFLPLNFLLLRRLLESQSRLNVSLMVISKALFFYQGYVPTVFMVSFLELTYLLYIKRQTLGRVLINKVERAFWKSYFATHIWVAIFILPLFLSMWYQIQLSAYRSQRLPFDEFISASLPVIQTLRSQFFLFQDRSIFGASSALFFIGPILFALFVLFFFSKLRKNFIQSSNHIWPMMAIVTFLLSTSLHAVLYSIPPFNTFRWPFRYYIYFLFFLTISAAVFFNTLAKMVKKTAIVSIIAILVIFLNLVVTWHSGSSALDYYTIQVPPKEYGLKTIINPSYRVLTYNLPIEKFDNQDTKKNYYKYLTANYAMMFGYLHLGGCDPLISTTNNDLSLQLNYQNNFTNTLDLSLLGHLNSWGVRYIISDTSPENRAELVDKLGLNPVFFDQPENLAVYENIHADPVLYYRNNPSSPLKYELGINTITIYPYNDQPQPVILNIAPLPGYGYTIDQSSTQPLSPNTSGKFELLFPEGTKKVTIRYVDTPFLVGVVISAMLVALILTRHYSFKLNSKAG